MISNEKPYYLVKFIDKKWADRLLDGEMFMRAIACFGDISTIRKLYTYNSELFYVKSTSSIAALPNTDLNDWTYSKKLISSLFTPDTNADITIAIIENKIEDNYFSAKLTDKSGIITFYQAETILRDANIDLFNYLLLTIYEIITLYQISNNKIDKNIEQLIHDETRGCIFDMVGNKYDLIYSASNAHICQQCEACLLRCNLPSNFISILKKELKRIRKSKYYILMEFVKQRPICSLIITTLFSILIKYYRVISLS